MDKSASSEVFVYTMHLNYFLSFKFNYGKLFILCPTQQTLNFVFPAGSTGSPPQTKIFVFTDADAKDKELKSTVLALIESTKSVVCIKSLF